MSKLGKVIIVVVLLAAIVVVFVVKQKNTTAEPVETNGASGVSLPKLVEVGSGSCVPCKAMKPIIEKLEKEYADKFKIEFHDIKVEPEAISKFKVNMIPVQIFYDVNGVELFRHEGFYSKEDILKKWKEFGVE
jgi:thioredoxin 1